MVSVTGADTSGVVANVSAAVTWNVSVGAVPPVLQYVMMPVVALTVAVPLVGAVVTLTVVGLAESPVPVSVAPVNGLMVVHWPADTLPVWGCRTGAAGGELMTVLEIGWNWYAAWVHVPPVVRQPATCAAGYALILTLTGVPARLMLAFVSNSDTVVTMLPVPVAVTPKLHDGRVSVPPAANVADPVVASRYGNVVPVAPVEPPGPWNVADAAMVAVQVPATAAVHSVTDSAPVVVVPVALVNDQLPPTMLLATKVDWGGTGMTVVKPLM
ncbi:MAG: hypothetical protein ACYCU7_07980 [Acidimicrobiales bacterium]